MVSTEIGSLPDAPLPPPAQNATSIADAAGDAVKTIGRDEWHFIKAPFQKKALIWDGLFLATPTDRERRECDVPGAAQLAFQRRQHR